MNPQYSIRELLGLETSPSFVVELSNLNMKSFKKLFRIIVKLDV